MGKATITAGGADGLYSVTMDYGKKARDDAIVRVIARMGEIAQSLIDIQALVDQKKALEDAAKVAAEASIEAYAQASKAVPVSSAAIKTTLDAYTKASTTLAKAKGVTAEMALTLAFVKAEQAQLEKDLSYWQGLAVEETRELWCADLTENATGDVTTLEIPGEGALVIIEPEAPSHAPATAGYLTAREVMTPAQVFFNAAILPGWQKFKPTYRRGTITAIDADANVVDVLLESADKSSAQKLVINQTPTLERVPVQYMTCHSGAFDVGDRCVVKFTDQDWTKPKVVGFVDHPKACVNYEFWATEHVSSATLGTPGFDSPIPFQVGSAVRWGGSPKPVFSTALTSESDTPKWVKRAFDYEPPGPDPKTTFITWNSWQTVKCFEYVTWPNNGLSSIVMSTQAQAPGWNSQCNWFSSRTSSRLGNFGIYAADVGRDVKPTIYRKEGDKGGVPDYPQPWVWWRRATVQSAGGKDFFICTDNVGRFQVYPVKNYDPTRLLTPGQYQMFTPPYPAWVTVPDPEDYVNQQRHWLWAFDSEGKRAVSCPFHSTRSEFYKSMEPKNRYASLLPEDLAAVSAPEGSMVLGYEDIPGLVEFGITITVTGEGDMDFSVAFELLRNDYFPVSGRYIFEAAYALPFKGELDGTTYPATDTLLTAELQCFTPDGDDYVAGPSPIPDVIPYNYFVDNIKNVQAKWVFNENDGALVPTELRRHHAAGPISFRFLNTEGYRNMVALGASGVGYASGWQPTMGANLNLVAGGTKFFHANSAVNFNGHNPPPEGAEGARMGYLHCLELRTLSITHNEHDFSADTSKISLIHYNEVIGEITGTLGRPPPIVPVALPEATVPVPVAGLAVYQHLLTTALNTEWGQGFSIHPAGHWSHSVTAEFYSSIGVAGGLDIVQPKGRQRMKHKDLFNQAFEQNRDYSFYESTEYGGKVLWDHGSFRSAGVWITF